MTPVLRALLRRERWREIGQLVAFALPWGLVVAELGPRLLGHAWTVLLLKLAAAACLLLAFWRWRAHNGLWLVRQLNARRPDLEDSADLLLTEAPLSQLQLLQRDRLRKRLSEHPPRLASPSIGRTLLLSTMAALLLLGAASFWPASPAPQPHAASRHAPSPAQQAPARLAGITLKITPPTHTRQPIREQHTLSARAPQGSLLRWELRFTRTPATVTLQRPDGSELPLQQQGDNWTALLRLQHSHLYRLRIDGAAPSASPLHRLEAIPDQPPQVEVLQPARTLSLRTPAQRTWEAAFLATDDYGIAATATLHITLAQGSGEAMRFNEQRVTLTGSGPSTRQRFAHRLNLQALGMAEGDDLIVQLEVHDLRPDGHQVARSPSLILRWPPPAATLEGSDMEGAVKRVLPAYFRSQRQIILDAEALLRQQKQHTSARFLQKSDAIGVDQRILRLRYGQFLGEEAEGAPTPPSDEIAEEADHDAATPQPPGKDANDGHADEHANAGLGQPIDLLEAYGHTHDIAEAATLLDPQTRATLKLALDQMWQSERQLRQGAPRLALPHAYKALGYIKQVQQAERIFLARVGPELPPIDPSRRLGGKRDGLAPRPDTLQKAPPTGEAVSALWQALAAPEPVPLQQLEAMTNWLRAQPAETADALALQSALDAVRTRPACRPCHEELRSVLWPLLPTPPAAVSRRPANDEEALRYLDALDVQPADVKQ